MSDSRRLQRWVTGAGVLLIVLMVGADSYEAWQDYRTAILRSEDTQLAIARATAEQTARMVQEIDVVLADQAQRWGAADSAPRSGASVASGRHALSVRAFDGSLRSRRSAARHDRPGADADVDYRGRRFFSTLEHAAPGTLYIGQPAGQVLSDVRLGRAIRDPRRYVCRRRARTRRVRISDRLLFDDQRRLVDQAGSRRWRRARSLPSARAAGG